MKCVQIPTLFRYDNSIFLIWRQFTRQEYRSHIICNHRESDLTYEGESVYNYLQVKEDEENVVLSTNVLFGVQSILKK